MFDVGDYYHYGALCIECRNKIGEVQCPSGYYCGSFDEELPYMCIPTGGAITVTCIDFDDNEDIINPTIDSYLEDSYTSEIYSEGGSSKSNDYCVDDNTLAEYYCSSSNDYSDLKIKNCKDFGSNYVCDYGKCTETITPPSDLCTEEILYNPPQSYLQKGSVANIGEIKTDVCLDGEILKDFRCSNGNNKVGDIVSTSFDCSTILGKNGLNMICNDGICIENSECINDADCITETCLGLTNKCIDSVCTTEGSCLACVTDKNCDDGNDDTTDKCVNNICSNVVKNNNLLIFLYFAVPILIVFFIVLLYIAIRKR